MSNKTPPEPAKKTASAPKSRSGFAKLAYISFALMMLLAIVAYGVIIFNRGTIDCGIRISDTNQLDGPGIPQRYSGPKFKCLRLERVSAPADLQRGLSGRKTMAEDQGMLFIFDQPAKNCFWMKDMNFPIDIIWLDSAKKVVTIKENAQPSSYPESFCPDAPAKYVIEVNAGVADRAYLSEGSQLQF